MRTSLSIHSSSFSVPESVTASSASFGLENRNKGNRVPRQGFLKLAKSRRFVAMIEIFDRTEQYDLDAWLFPGADATPAPGSMSSPVPGISLLSESPTKSPDPPSGSPASSNRRPSFRSLSPLTKSPPKNDEYNLHLFRGETPLHVLLRYKPTEKLVNCLIEYLSQSEKSLGVPEDSVDMLGRTPLHVACANGCSVAVIGRLINGVSAAMPAFAKDSMGRHALHWACANPNGDQECLENKSFRLLRKNKFVESMTMVDNMVNVVKTLLKAYPESAFIADKDGNRPKDLARLHKADERILLLLSREENRCELDNDYQKHFASVADTTVLRGNASTIPTTLPYSRARDDVSSIGSSALSYCEPKDEEEEEGESSSTTAKDMLKKSPFQKMTNIDEVIRFVEKNMFRPPLGLEEFDLFDKKNIE